MFIMWIRIFSNLLGKLEWRWFLECIIGPPFVECIWAGFGK